MQKRKKEHSSLKSVTSETFKRVHNEIQKNKQHGIMEELPKTKKKNLKKKKSFNFKITTCERFQKVNNDTLQELRKVRQQLGTT